jgi:hypothetical protein
MVNNPLKFLFFTCNNNSFYSKQFFTILFVTTFCILFGIGSSPIFVKGFVLQVIFKFKFKFLKIKRNYHFIEVFGIQKKT